jgi:hypothetical protein
MKTLSRIAAALAIVALLVLAVSATAATPKRTTTVKAAATLPTLTGSVDVTWSKGQCLGGHFCWVCKQPVNLTSVTIHVDTNTVDMDALSISNGCTGHIGTVTVDTKSADGIKIAANLNGDVNCTTGTNCAHDLTIDNGTITGDDLYPGDHKDCLQALGGRHIHLNYVVFACKAANNAQFYLSYNKQAAVATPPVDVVCDHCEFHPTRRTTTPSRSGRETRSACPTRSFAPAPRTASSSTSTRP